MHSKIPVICAGSAALLFIPALIQAASLNKADMQFMKMAATENMTEAHLGQMAEAQGSTQSVKEYGKRLSDDHTTSYEGLTVLAKKVGEDIPQAISPNKTMDQLAHLKGKGFDRAFVQDEVRSHKSTLLAFQNEADHGSDPGVKTWAKNMIPTIQSHLQEAQKLLTPAK